LHLAFWQAVQALPYGAGLQVSAALDKDRFFDDMLIFLSKVLLIQLVLCALGFYFLPCLLSII
jgi:hypothetical protein